MTTNNGNSGNNTNKEEKGFVDMGFFPVVYLVGLTPDDIVVAAQRGEAVRLSWGTEDAGEGHVLFDAKVEGDLLTFRVHNRVGVCHYYI